MFLSGTSMLLDIRFTRFYLLSFPTHSAKPLASSPLKEVFKHARQAHAKLGIRWHELWDGQE